MSEMFLFHRHSIIKCLGDGLDVVLPEDIDCVDSSAFEGVKLKSLTIPAKLINALSIKSPPPPICISWLNCETLIFENGIQDLTGIEFVGAHIGKVVLPNGIKKIGPLLFVNGKGTIREFIMPDSVTEIGNAFNDVTFGEFHFSKNLKKTSTVSFSECTFSDLIVDTIQKKLENSAFHSCRAKNVVLADSIESIGRHAFAMFQCDTIQLPKRLKTIHSRAFMESNIREIILPESVIAVDKEAFIYCESERIVLSPNLKKIQPRIFYGCSNLKELIIPEGVESINLSAISECPRLKKLTLPSTLKEILYFGTEYISAVEEIINFSQLTITTALFPRLKILKNMN